MVLRFFSETLKEHVSQTKTYEQSASEKETICAGVTSLWSCTSRDETHPSSSLFRIQFFQSFIYHLSFNSAPAATYTATFCECRPHHISRAGVMWRLPTTAHSSICSGWNVELFKISPLKYSSATTKCVNSTSVNRLVSVVKHHIWSCDGVFREDREFHKLTGSQHKPLK